MAQRPFIADMGARFGEWLMTQTSDGDLKVSPVNTNTNSQRAFRADAGLKMGDWKFYDDSFHLHVTPNGVSSVGTPTEYDLSNVTAVTDTLGSEFYSNNPTGGYVQTGDRVAANSTHAFFLEGRQQYSQFVLSAVNLSTGLLDYTIIPSSSSIPDNGIVANDSYVLISTNQGGKLYSTSTQQLLGTVPSSSICKMSDNYVAMTSPNDINQIDVRELDPTNNFPLVNSFTGASNIGFGNNGRFDLSDTHVVIGAPHYTEDYQGTTHTEHTGKVEVFNIQSGVLEHTFYGRDGIHHTSHDKRVRFGNNISIDGDNVAIVSDASFHVSEAFRIYNYKTSEFITRGERPVRPINTSYYVHELGQLAMAFSGGLVFLYCSDLRDGSTYSPNQAVFIYNYSGEMVLRIDDPDISTAGQYYEYTYFGQSLAVSGDKLILGARSYSTSTSAGGAQTAIGYQVGKGYIYDLTKTYAEVVIAPVVNNSSQRPFIVDAGLKIGDWTLAQNEDGDIYVSTSLNSSTAISSGTVPVPTLDPTALTNSTTMTGLRVDHRVGRKLYLKNNELMSYNQYPDRSVTIYDTTTNTVLYDYNFTFGPQTSSYGGDQADFNSTYFAVGCTTNDKVNVYNKSDGTIAHQFTSGNGSFGKIISMNENYIAISTPSQSMVHLYSLDTFAYIDHITTTSGEVHTDTTKLTDDNKFAIPTKINNGSKQVHIYDVSDTGFTLDKTITEPNGSGSGNENFGRYSIDMDDTHLVVTANLNYSGINQYLVAYVFDISTGNLVSTLEHPSMIANDFPNSVKIALNGNYAYYTDAAENHMNASLTVFDITTGSIVASVSNPKLDASWGYGVAVNDSALYVGGFDADDNGNNSGTIWVYTN